MKNKLSILIFITLVAINGFGQDNDYNEILAVAQKGYKNYLEKIPRGQESYYGFNGREEFSVAKIGKPYQMITLNNKFFEDNIIGKGNYLIATDEWRVPIVVKNEFRTLITVAKMSGKWEVVGLGGALLAKELREFEKKYPSKYEIKKILRVYQTVSDFILIPTDRSSLLKAYPLESAKISLELNQTNLTYYPLSDLLQVIKKNILNK